MATRNRGFTLIEILVVITIIAGLMAMGFALFGGAITQREKLQTQTRRDTIAAALEQLKSPQILGEYPPADIRQLRGLKGADVAKDVGFPNDTNLGIESVYVAIMLQGHGVFLADMEDDWLANLDDDNMAVNVTKSESPALYEFVDAWGNPFAYFSPRELKNHKEVSKYILAGGAEVEVKPWMSEKTKLPVNQGKYQLFSAGPDGVFNTEDDIGNW